MIKLIPCRHATLLIEQRADNALASANRRNLWVHLLYCPYCRRYAQQSIRLAALARRNVQLAGLSAEARQRLRQRLSEAGL